MRSPEVIVIGPAVRTRPLCVALRRAGRGAEALSPEDALRRPGSLSPSCLAVFADRPGAFPMLEAEAYIDSVGALHVSWDSEAAEVGPFVLPGYGPCPGCLSGRARPGVGSQRALAAWASSWAALQAAAILDGSTDLVGASWAWRLDSPGLGLTAWPRRVDCTTPACRQP